MGRTIILKRGIISGNSSSNLVETEKSQDFDQISDTNIYDSNSCCFIQFLFENCLFPPDSKRMDSKSTGATASKDANEVTALRDSDSSQNADVVVAAMCQTWESRDLAYALLYQLCTTDKDNFSKLVNVMNEGPQAGALPAELPQAGLAVPVHLRATRDPPGPPAHIQPPPPPGRAAADACARRQG